MASIAVDSRIVRDGRACASPGYDRPSCLLPEYPAEVAEADAAVVADALLGSYGGSTRPVRSGGGQGDHPL